MSAPIDDVEEAPSRRTHIVPEDRTPSTPAQTRAAPAAPGTPVGWWLVGGLLVLGVVYWLYALAQADLARVSP